MKQFELADLFDRIADLLELKSGENPFRIRAYRRAALNLRSVPGDLEEKVRAGSLEKIPGVGADLAQKIEEFISTGRLEYLERLKKQVPESLVTLVGIPGVGPKTARLIHDRLKVRSIEDLERVLKEGKLRLLPGLREKKEQNILRGIRLVKAGRDRMLLGTALTLGRNIMGALKSLPEVLEIELAGSLRRRQETIGDIDILVSSRNARPVMERFIKLAGPGGVQAHGETKSSIRTGQGIQVDLRVVEPDSFGAALVYFTGSKEHNIRIRSLAVRMGLTVNEYGVFKGKSQKRVAGRSETDVYRVLGMKWVPPELREDRGEVEAARKGRIPKLLEEGDLKGSIHNHSKWTDGAHSIEEVAKAIRQKGYRYMVLSDHSRSLRIAGGLSIPELEKEMREVRRLNQRLAPFRILMGSEVDILPDGRLDYPDSVLARLDVVIAAVHSAFKQPRAAMTRRIVKAIQNPYVSILAHPTGRLLGEREPVEVDLEEVSRAAAAASTALEINCYPQRLDLNDVHIRQAREAGARFVVSTDTHVLANLENLELGVATARRGWLAPSEVLNTLQAEPFLAWARKKRPVRSR